MTSAPINDYPALQAYRSVKNTDGGAAVQGEDVSESFQNAMKQAGSMPAGEARETAGQTRTGAESRTTGMVTGTPEAYTGKTQNQAAKVHNKDASDKTERGDAKQTEEVKEAVEKVSEETEKEIVKEVADELDVTEEEVEAAMAALGLTVLDLRDQTNMAALVTQLTGENDPMTLLTDENLFVTIGQLAEQIGEIIDQNVGELSKELGMDPDELLQLLQASVKEGDADAQTGVVVEIIQDAPGEETQTVTADAVLEEEAAEPEKVAAAEEAGTKEQTGQDQSMMNARQESSPLINQMFDARTVENGEIRQAEMPFTSYVDTADIINQIGDYVKIHQSESMSEMEISLHPESLGNIHLQVAAREGVITATITTQNEAVREALMVQAMVLKEELNEQGVKVEVVEVTVASHEFERDMKNGGEEARNLFEQQVQKQTRRRIVIDGLQQAQEMLENEDLTDAEKLQIDMMAKSGNSVDFTA